jgi:ABC-type transport system involved in multi-copper enzyme maturation permease subunit
MLSLIKIEWLKIKKYPAFWWMIGIIALSYPGVNSMFLSIYKEMTGSKDMVAQIASSFLGNPFAFPEAWHSIAYFSSTFIMIPAVLVIMLINNEYSYKTYRQNIIDGWSRTDFMLSKLIDVVIVSVVVTIIYTLVTIGFGIVADSTTTKQWNVELQYIPLFLLQTFAQLSLAFLAGYFIKKAFLALGVFLFYSVVIENIIVGYCKVKNISVARFLPFEISDKLIPPPAFWGKFGVDGEAKYKAVLAQIPMHIGLTIALTTIIWGICFWHNKKRDL